MAAQSSPPTVAVLRATGDESARVTRMFLEALRGIGHEDGRTFRFVEYSADRSPHSAAGTGFRKPETGGAELAKSHASRPPETHNLLRSKVCCGDGFGRSTRLFVNSDAPTTALRVRFVPPGPEV